MRWTSESRRIYATIFARLYIIKLQFKLPEEPLQKPILSN